jgi:hypothetical protein
MNNYQNKQGQWQNESSFVSFTDDETGLTCIVLRDTRPLMGCLCGYVVIPDDLRETVASLSVNELEVHGGVTFNDYITKVELGDNPLYAIGFDCAHAGDLIPGMDSSEGVYRNIGYVKAECRKLAKQVKAFIEVKRN